MAKKPSERFPRQRRILRSSDYQKIYSGGRKEHSNRFVLFGQVNELSYHRLGVTVSRKVGSAVVRNHIKRMFREVFRRYSAEIPNHLDLVVNAKAGCVGASCNELRAEFMAAVRRICR